MSGGNRFDRTAALYAAHTAGRDWAGFVAWCECRPTDRMLDVAGGPGALAAAVIGSVAAVTVLDAAPSLLEYAPAGAERVEGRAEQLPFPAAAFDLVTCVNSLHHIARPARALDEMARVLAPGREDRARGLRRRPRSPPRPQVGGDRAPARSRARPADRAGRVARAAAGGRTAPGCRGDVAAHLGGGAVARRGRLHRPGGRAGAGDDRRAASSRCACGGRATGAGPTDPYRGRTRRARCSAIRRRRGRSARARIPARAAPRPARATGAGQRTPSPRPRARASVTCGADVRGGRAPGAAAAAASATACARAAYSGAAAARAHSIRGRRGGAGATASNARSNGSSPAQAAASAVVRAATQLGIDGAQEVHGHVQVRGRGRTQAGVGGRGRLEHGGEPVRERDGDEEAHRCNVAPACGYFETGRP